MRGFQLGVCGLALIASSVFGADAAAPDKLTLKDQTDKVSYTIGLNVGQNLSGQLKRDEIKLNQDALIQGFKDALKDSERLMTEAQCMEVMQVFQKEMMAKQETLDKERSAKNKVLAEKNKKEGAAFLAANAKKPGVKTLPSGLQYKVIKNGAGKSPKPTDTVAAHYRGTLIDGTEFDSSAKGGQPIEFGVGDVIKGWTEALQLMKVGSKWELYIPSELAYGEQARSEVIGPNSVLVFEVELVSIK